MALRAVIFDYGIVLTGPPEAAAHAAMLRATGLDNERFEELYWRHRSAFDAGKLTGEAYWNEVARDAGLTLTEAQVAELVGLDARHWMVVDPAMLAWQQALKQRGLKTAILSNMGDTVHHAMERELKWLGDFDVLVWSYQLGISKPDAAIYHFTLEKLNVRAGDALFIDDRQANVSAALALGMRSVLFTSVAALRESLVAQGLDGEMGLP